MAYTASLGCPTGQTPPLTRHPSRLCRGQFANHSARAPFQFAGGSQRLVAFRGFTPLSGQHPFDCTVF